jgi:molybdopterin molybdotransferase
MDRLLRLREEVLGAVPVLPAERVPVTAAARRWLAAPAVAAHDFPSFACSAMDGYAVRSVDAVGNVSLTVTRTIYAGDDPGAAIGPGEAVRIFTGGPVPGGADGVVREEATRERDGRVSLRDPVRPGENVRMAGEDVQRGGLALGAGTFAGPRQLALLRAVGVERIEVVRLPRMALISTGDELVLGRTPNSNGAAIVEALRAVGAEVESQEVGDDLDAITAAVRRALESADAVITIGGVSVGARDHVPAAVAGVGGEVRVHGVPMKPGKPFLFALVRGKPVFGLPGSPSACLVAFEVFVRPAVLRMAGAGRPCRRTLRLPVAERVTGRPGRSRFLWARLGPDGRVRPIGRDAAQVRGPALADTLIHLPEGVADVEEGTPVEAWLLEDDGS